MTDKTYFRGLRWDTVMHGRTLGWWKTELYNAQATEYGWTAPAPGCEKFGAEIIGLSVWAMRNAEDVDYNEGELAHAVHEEWANTYRHWRDHPPPAPWLQPANALGDERRDRCAGLRYADLPEDEKAKDMFIVREFLRRIGQ